MTDNGTPRVLLAEDDPDIRMIVEVALRDVGGMSVECCADGPCALEAFRRRPADIVLLDVMMPGMDGRDVLAALRAIPGGAEVPVLFVTARVRRDDILAYKALGAVGVIVKPFDPMTLADQIRGYLKGASEDKAAANPYRRIVDRFLGDLPGRLERLNAAAVGLGEPWDEVARQRLRDEVHRLAGTAGSVGFDALGEQARLVEEDVLARAAPDVLRAGVDRLAEMARDLTVDDSSLLRS